MANIMHINLIKTHNKSAHNVVFVNDISCAMCLFDV